VKIKYSKAERLAGLFIVLAIVSLVGLTAFTLIRKGYFQAKVGYHTRVLSAEGLRPGSVVTISGIRAGEITEVELLSADNIIVHFDIFEKFRKQIKTDSKVQIIRPFVVGDKAIEVTVGSVDLEELKAGEFIESQVAFDMLDMVSGKRLGPFLGTIESLMMNVSRLAKAFADPKRTDSLIKMFDRMNPLIISMNHMSDDVSSLAKELNVLLPQIRKESPRVGQDLSQLIGHLNVLAGAVAPAIKEVGPELPHASHRAVEALDEIVVTLKAIQKSFLLSSKVKDVKEEELQKRAPTGD